MALSDRYTHEDLGITRAELNRLCMAVDDGIVPAGVAFSKRNISMFKHGGLRVDELIRAWSRGNYKDPFIDREIFLSRREFEDIIHEAVTQTQGIKNYEIDGKMLYVRFYSNSEKSTWDAEYNFNDGGNITGFFECRTAYPEAKSPRWLGDNIERLIKRLVDEKDYS